MRDGKRTPPLSLRLTFEERAALEHDAADMPLGNADDLRSVEETRAHVASQITPRLKDYMTEARATARTELAPLEQQRQCMAAKHQSERLSLDGGQRARLDAETRQRAERLRKGLAGIWDRLRGEYARLRKQNEAEAFFALQRDREQRHALVQAQRGERQTLQMQSRVEDTFPNRTASTETADPI